MTPAVSSVAWYDDLCSCLQIDIGHVLELHGWEPVRALASGWRFTAPKEPVGSVEYYHPALGDHLCLHHPVTLRWHEPADAADAHRDLLEALGTGLPAVVAVNNFHLPFRPAYRDVHAAHLIIVTGYDPAADAYRVVDPMPPAYAGPLPRTVLEAARGDISIDDDSDPFFAGRSPAWHRLEVRPTGPQPDLDEDWLHTVVAGNLAELRAPGQGLDALASVLDGLAARVRADGVRALREVYVLGWHAQAEAALHAAFLYGAARDLRRPDLAEAARWADSVAHAWTGLRVSAAHAEPRDLPRVARHGDRLHLAWEHALQRMEQLTGRTP